MKNLRKLTKGIIGSMIGLLAVMIFLLVICLFYKKSSTEVLVGILVTYLLFAELVAAAVGIYLVVVFCVYKKAKEKLRAIPGFSEARFERETGRMPQYKNILLCSDAICYADSAYLVRVIPLADIIWVYQDDQKNTLRSTLWIYTKTKDKYGIFVSMKGKGALKNVEAGRRYLMRLIARKNKNVIIGYDDSCEQMYKNNFEQLLMRTRGREIVDSAVLEQEYIANNYYQKDFQ